MSSSVLERAVRQGIDAAEEAADEAHGRGDRRREVLSDGMRCG